MKLSKKYLFKRRTYDEFSKQVFSSIESFNNFCSLPCLRTSHFRALFVVERLINPVHRNLAEYYWFYLQNIFLDNSLQRLNSLYVQSLIT